MKKLDIKWIIFIVTALGGFMSMLDSSSMNVALFEISKTFSAPIGRVQWVVVTYILVLSTLLTLFGKLNDIINRKYLYTAGYLLFGFGSLLNLVSPNLPCLIFFRTIQAIGASILMSNSYAIITSVFKGRKRAEALGYNGAFISLAGMSGPALGGFLMSLWGWRAIFIPSIIVSLVGGYFAFKYIPAVRLKKKFRFDLLGMILLLFSTFSLLLLVAEGHSWGWLSKKIICLFVLCIFFGALFYFEEKKAKHPLIDFTLFKSRQFTLGNFAMMFSYFALFANVLLFPFYTQEILKVTPLVTGLLILPFSFAFLVSALVGSAFAGKISSKTLTLMGSALIVVGIFIMSLLKSTPQYYIIILANVLMGLGSGFYQPSANTAVMNSAPKGSTGIASGILALYRNMGMLLGIMISISIFEAVKKGAMVKGLGETASFLNGYHMALYIGGAFAILCLYLSYCAYKTKKKCV